MQNNNDSTSDTNHRNGAAEGAASGATGGAAVPDTSSATVPDAGGAAVPDAAGAAVPDAAGAAPEALSTLKRLGGLCACLLFFIWRAQAWATFWSKSLWALETALYGVLVFSYATRLAPLVRAWGWRDLVAPYVIAALPFAVFVLPVNETALAHTFVPGQLLLLVGTAITVTAMATLGRSFSISVEARAPVTSGLYRYMRHPVYVGEMISLWGVALIRLSWLSMGLTLAFCVLQAWRARREEETLARVFPRYAAYRAQTGWWGATR